MITKKSRMLRTASRAELQIERDMLKKRKRNNKHTKGQPIESKTDAPISQDIGDSKYPSELSAK